MSIWRHTQSMSLTQRRRREHSRSRPILLAFQCRPVRLFCHSAPSPEPTYGLAAGQEARRGQAVKALALMGINPPAPSTEGRGTKIQGRPHEPSLGDTARKTPRSTTLRGKEPSRWSMPVPGDARPETVSPAWRVEPWRAAGSSEWELQTRSLDDRGCPGTEMAARFGKEPRYAEIGR
jgi:hypothetical protein